MRKTRVIRPSANSPKLTRCTTTWVLTEAADALCNAAHRRTCAQFLRQLQNDKEITLIAPSMQLFDQGMALYESRDDKDWSLTDCISFVVMTAEALTEALTADHHFEQAGFVALLK